MNRRSNQVKQSCNAKDRIETNQIRAKNIIVILSDTTVAHFEVLFADSLAETILFFFSFQYKEKKFGKTTSDYIISLKPIHVQNQFMTILFLPYFYIYYVTYDLRSILLRQYLNCSRKRNVQCKMSCSFSTVDSVCGPTPYAPNELHVIPLKSCRKDLTDYLTNLGVSGSRGIGTRINEADVILNFAGLHSLSEDYRMSKARYELTTHYQKLKSSCSHPSHKGEVKKLKNPCRVNKKVSEEIYQEFQVSVPIGSGKCNTEANI